MASQDYLYANDETASAVIEHTSDHDFEKSSKPRLVEFYSPFCGGCRFFKPQYVAIAEALISKYDDVEVYAVSCSPHKDVCSKHQITGYPALYAFPAGATVGTYLKKSSLGGSYSIKSIAKKLSLKPSAAQSVRKLVDDETKENKTDDEKEEDNEDEEEEDDEDEKEKDNEDEKEGDDEDEKEKDNEDEKEGDDEDEKEKDNEDEKEGDDEDEKDKDNEDEKEGDNEEEKEKDKDDERKTESLDEKTHEPVLEQKSANGVDENDGDKEEDVKEDVTTVAVDTLKAETTSSLAAEGETPKDPVPTVQADISKEEKDDEEVDKKEKHKDDEEDEKDKVEEDDEDEKHKEKEDDEDEKDKEKQDDEDENTRKNKTTKTKINCYTMVRLRWHIVPTQLVRLSGQMDLSRALMPLHQGTGLRSLERER
ncbi:Erv1 / Alr family [Fragilaria crotonensis]|nr:Erv1 / Alr family [Fragilaria crotonensis]